MTNIGSRMVTVQAGMATGGRLARREPGVAEVMIAADTAKHTAAVAAIKRSRIFSGVATGSASPGKLTWLAIKTTPLWRFPCTLYAITRGGTEIAEDRLPRRIAEENGMMIPDIQASTFAASLALAEALFEDLRINTADAPGVTRASFGSGERYAHELMAHTAETLALEVRRDFIGNLYMTLPGQDRTRPAVIMGSHLDSVPHGGNFDGAAGVVAGLAALAAFRRAGYQPAQDLTVMGIRAEELSWFPSHYIGSRAAFGRLPADTVDACIRFDTGLSLGHHMAAEGFDADAVRSGRASLDPRAIRAYVELHIEQGPVLVRCARPVAIVTAIRGNLRYKHCRVIGKYDHAGGVPREARRDAVLAAADFVSNLEQMWLRRESAGQDLICTVGQFFTDPTQHTMTKISGDVRFTMDIRGADNSLLLEVHDEIEKLAARVGAARGVDISLGPYTNALPATMDPTLRRMLRGTAAELGLDDFEMASGAGHDCAVFANEGIPCAMIFVRNEHGSHNPEEAMALEDFAQGLRLLTGFLQRLDGVR
jgi:N-carbamoyl-L-amino-acid hydrolase